MLLSKLKQVAFRMDRLPRFIDPGSFKFDRLVTVDAHWEMSSEAFGHEDTPNETYQLNATIKYSKHGMSAPNNHQSIRTDLAGKVPRLHSAW